MARLVEKAGTLAFRRVKGKGGVVGTARHEHATALLDRYQRTYRDMGVKTKAYKNVDGERSFVDAYHAGSNRVWDWKFGSGRMSPAQRAKYERHYPRASVEPLHYTDTHEELQHGH